MNTRQLMAIGCGFIPVFHAQAAHSVLGKDRIMFGAAVETEENKNRPITIGIDPRRVYTDLELALTRENGRCTIGLVAQPNNIHHEGAIALAEAGYSIVCEKPLADTLEHARLIRDTVREYQAESMVPFTYIGHSTIIEMAHLIKTLGLTDKFLGADLRYKQAWLWDPNNPAWRRDPNISGEGGATGDILSHVLAIAMFVLGCPKIKDVFGHRRHVILGKEYTDDDVVAIVRLESGAELNASAIQYVGGTDNDIEVEFHFKEGVSFGWSSRSDSETLWMTGEKNGPRQLLTRAHFTSPIHAATFTPPSMHIDGYTNALARLYQSLLWSITETTPNGMAPFHPDIEFGYRISQIIDAVIRSSKLRLPTVELED